MAHENVLAIIRPPAVLPLALDPSNRMASLTVPITTYRQLREHLSKLGDPPTGYIRVYRGQTKDYGSLLPCGLRPWSGAPRSRLALLVCTSQQRVAGRAGPTCLLGSRGGLDRSHRSTLWSRLNLLGRDPLLGSGALVCAS
jgi:hypothetical protein